MDRKFSTLKVLVHFLTKIVPVVFPSSEARARSRLSTPSKSDCGCSRLTPSLPSERFSLARTRTGNLLIRKLTRACL